ncbi:hypothetical protein Bbelb_321860, partial [Branchiostoma belcheri]
MSFKSLNNMTGLRETRLPLENKYTCCLEACSELSLPTLESRREELCTKFGRGLLNSPLYRNWLPPYRGEVSSRAYRVNRARRGDRMSQKVLSYLQSQSSGEKTIVVWEFQNKLLGDPNSCDFFPTPRAIYQPKFVTLACPDREISKPKVLLHFKGHSSERGPLGAFAACFLALPYGTWKATGGVPDGCRPIFGPGGKRANPPYQPEAYQPETQQDHPWTPPGRKTKGVDFLIQTASLIQRVLKKVSDRHRNVSETCSGTSRAGGMIGESAPGELEVGAAVQVGQLFNRVWPDFKGHSSERGPLGAFAACFLALPYGTWKATGGVPDGCRPIFGPGGKRANPPYQPEAYQPETQQDHPWTPPGRKTKGVDFLIQTASLIQRVLKKVSDRHRNVSEAKLLPAEGESCLHDLPPSGQNTARISDQVMIPAEGESCLHDLSPSGQNTARISDQVGYPRVLTEISDYGVDSGSYCPSR